MPLTGSWQQFRGFGFFRGPKWRKNRADLEIGWTPDGKSALAIYDGRWGSEGVVWIEPQTRKIVDVQKQLEQAFRSVLQKREPKLAADVSIDFSEPVILQNGRLIVNASGTIPKHDDTAAYQLKFDITGTGENVRFRLQHARVIDQPYTTPVDNPEVELNKVYAQLRTKLAEGPRSALRDEQTNWLRLREGIADDDRKADFTNHRIVELRVRLQSR